MQDKQYALYQACTEAQSVSIIFLNDISQQIQILYPLFHQCQFQSTSFLLYFQPFFLVLFSVFIVLLCLYMLFVRIFKIQIEIYLNYLDLDFQHAESCFFSSGNFYKGKVYIYMQRGHTIFNFFKKQFFGPVVFVFQQQKFFKKSKNAALQVKHLVEVKL
ncbi:transmembrane protein, putative (macronuclear) [Tetrahymena thermophila SB210]|uniref:Transmembrane protein, putative n=1 Tax=Tetrahymena thermophila (strain SB210) TaxID=312017 RepID=W7XIZ5_TETTS|nr:transmembrane protein, putative [Tetrahymena thermophila SB210]EWS75051.1 transmembrane protein, putative [Tetrahymena thermophila SB210]|eukprot:XP_012652416.1 transmembrane protein, putative [Tetrahymena thermophila SB210]